MPIPLKNPRFTDLSVENWRNFARVDVALQRRVFLVGPNAAGKSNFLDVFRFLHDMVAVGGGFQEAVRKRGGVRALRSLAAKKCPDIALRVHISDEAVPQGWVYELHFSEDRLHQPVIKKEMVSFGRDVLIQRPDEGDQNDPERLTQTYLEQVNANKPFRDVADFFASVRYFHLVPQLIREPDRSLGKSNDPYGGDFLEQIARTPEKARDSRLKRIRDALSVAVPQLEALELVRDAAGVPHLRGRHQHWRAHGAWQNEDQFSDGTLRLLGLLWAALDGTGPLLLEEPELSLHPDVVRFIPQMFARIQSRTGRQILTSTHSSDLLRDEGIGMDEVLLFEPGAEGTTVRSAHDLKDVGVLLDGGLSLAEIVVPMTKPMNASHLSLLAKED